MSNWVTPISSDVLSEFTTAEVATINNLLGGGSLITSRLDQILIRTVAEIRDYIRSGRYDVDISENTVPLSLVTDAIAISRWRFLLSVPLLKQLQTEDRKDAMTRGMDKLKAIGRQEFVPESPVESLVASAGMWNSENKLIMRTHPVTPPSTQFQQGLQNQQPYANPQAPSDAP